MNPAFLPAGRLNRSCIFPTVSIIRFVVNPGRRLHPDIGRGRSRPPVLPSPARQEPPLPQTPRPPRIVTLADPAWFATTPRLGPDGADNPDYGRVYFAPSADGGLSYSFDRAGRRFCRRLSPPAPRSGWLLCQGRRFRIGGPVEGPRR